jgi:hypothetical protein
MLDSKFIKSFCGGNTSESASYISGRCCCPVVGPLLANEGSSNITTSCPIIEDDRWSDGADIVVSTTIGTTWIVPNDREVRVGDGDDDDNDDNVLARLLGGIGGNAAVLPLGDGTVFFFDSDNTNGGRERSSRGDCAWSCIPATAKWYGGGGGDDGGHNGEDSKDVRTVTVGWSK